MALHTPLKKAYIDTCVVSEKINRELSNEDVRAIDSIFDAYRDSRIKLYTSNKVKAELGEIPPAYREPHINLCNTLASLPVIKIVRKFSMSPLGLPIRNVKHRQKERIDRILQGMDRWHVFIAASNRIEYLITTDRRTILRHKDAVLDAIGVKARSPSEFLVELNTNNG